MAWFPGAVRRPLPENETQPALVPTQLIFHTAVGERSPRDTFNRPGCGKESHGWTGRDRVEQYVTTDRTADAQWAGNRHAISWESADNGHPDRDPWTPYQIEQNAQVAAWANRTHGIPLRACRSWDDPGIGYHRQFKEWNKSNHSCPGNARVKQIPQIIARARQIVEAAAPTTPQEDDDMPLSDQDVARVAAAVWDHLLASGIVPGTHAQPAGQLLAWAASDAKHGRNAAQQGVATAGAIAGQVAGLAAGGLTQEQAEAAAEAGAEAALGRLGERLQGD